MVDSHFWRGKRVLLTGHTGFKGGWMAIWLRHLKADVIGVSLPPTGDTNLFDLARVDSGIESHFCDIRGLLTWFSMHCGLWASLRTSACGRP